MPKPIVVIKVNRYIRGEYQREITVMEANEIFESRFSDYHVLAFPSEIEELFEFQVFYEKDFTEIQYQELKNIIEDSLTLK